MPDTANTSEETAEQTARRVIKHHNILWDRGSRVVRIMWVIFLLSIALPVRKHESHLTTVILLMVYFAAVFGITAYNLWRERRYAHQLSDEEKEALRFILQADNNEYGKQARKILKLSGEAVPAREYVRASSSPEQTETLLRAAQPSTDTAQEQLLRPTQE